MKVCVSVGGRFHAFYLAEYLQRQGHLYHLSTSYPKFEVAKYGVDTKKVSTVVSKEIIERGYYKLFGTYPSNIAMCNWYDYIASLQIPLDADVYVIWSGFALKTIQKIRKHNPKAKIVLERGSAHIAEQAELLEKATKKSVIDTKMIVKEIAEYQSVDYISTISSYALRSFTERGFAVDKIVVNNMGVDLQDFPFIDRTLRATKNEFIVGYVGIMSSRKNIHGLILAVKKLVEQGLPIKLLLVGGIDNTTFDKQLLEQDFIVYQSSVPQEKLVEFYKQMNLFVLNSIEDGFGLVILQAMATGLAVIGTTNTGCPDVIQDEYNGFVIPIENSEVLAEKIEWCYHNQSKCLEMGLNAHKTASYGFTWEDYGKRYVQFLEKIVHQ